MSEATCEHERDHMNMHVNSACVQVSMCRHTCVCARVFLSLKDTNIRKVKIQASFY